MKIAEVRIELLDNGKIEASVAGQDWRQVFFNNTSRDAEGVGEALYTVLVNMMKEAQDEQTEKTIEQLHADDAEPDPGFEATTANAPDSDDGGLGQPSRTHGA